MKYCKVIKNGMYLPNQPIPNETLETFLGLETGFIQKRTGIQERYFGNQQTIEEMAIQAVKNLQLTQQDKQEIGLIVVATTTPKQFMPGIANQIQKAIELKPCICLDLLAGCSGYINAFDIANLYIRTEKVKKALVIGVDHLSNYTNLTDIGTAIVLSDGAGATLLEGTTYPKQYVSHIQAISDEKNILSCQVNGKIQMKGKEIYKYAVTETVKNIEELLRKAGKTVADIKYIVPHQSNLKIMKAMANRLKIEEHKMIMTIQTKGNTFCASIPIALQEMMGHQLVETGDLIILLGYGGGLNTGSILMEM